MPFKKYTLKLKENNNIINQNLPRFSLSYRTKREDPRHVSYDIITALSENNDIIIELDTNFFDNKLNIDGQCFQRFIDAAKSLGLTHSSKEFASTHSYNQVLRLFFSITNLVYHAIKIMVAHFFHEFFRITAITCNLRCTFNFMMSTVENSDIVPHPD
jgi:hypothetical protein